MIIRNVDEIPGSVFLAYCSTLKIKGNTISRNVDKLSRRCDSSCSLAGVIFEPEDRSNTFFRKPVNLYLALLVTYFLLAAPMAYSSTLKMEAVGLFKMAANYGNKK
jgi:hypothetical protein